MKQFTCEQHTATASASQPPEQPPQPPGNTANSERRVWMCASVADLNKIFPLHDPFIAHTCRCHSQMERHS